MLDDERQRAQWWFRLCPENPAVKTAARASEPLYVADSQAARQRRQFTKRPPAINRVSVRKFNNTPGGASFERIDTAAAKMVFRSG